MIPPPWAAAIVCSLCEKRELGTDGVYVARGFAFCRPCALLLADLLTGTTVGAA